MSREEFLSEKKQLEEERERLQRRKKELEEMISSRNDREFNLIYDEVALFISKLQYFGDRR